jgi:hypothetical protein
MVQVKTRYNFWLPEVSYNSFGWHTNMKKATEVALVFLNALDYTQFAEPIK